MSREAGAGGRARGVRLEPHGSKAGDDVITARQAVVSNASIWDTQKLLGEGVAEGWKHEAMQTPSTDSFMHLHLGESAAHALAEG